MKKNHDSISGAVFLVMIFLASGPWVPAQIGRTVKAPSQGIVPDVLGKTSVEAEAILKKSGYVCIVETLSVPIDAYRGREGKVVRQTPVAREKFAAGGRVKIVVYSPKIPLIPRVLGRRLPLIVKPRIVTPSNPQVNIRVWAYSSANMLTEGCPSYFNVLKTGSGVISKPVVVAWEIFGQNGVTLYADRMSFEPSKLYAKPSGPEGQFEIAASGFMLPIIFERVARKAVLTVDPDHAIAETDESDNGFELPFGRGESLPAAADPANVADLVPEFSPEMAEPPNNVGDRYLKFRLVNRGTANLRQPIKFYVILRTNDQDHVAQRDLAGTDLPVKPGESKMIDAQFFVASQYLRHGQGRRDRFGHGLPGARIR